MNNKNIDINTQNIRVGISVGDINGVGLEVILKTFEDSRMLEFCTPVIFASNKVVSFQKRHFNIGGNFNGINTAEEVILGKINVVNCWEDTPDTDFGKCTPEAGHCAFLSLQAAVTALKQRYVDVLVTAPINKANIQSENFHFPGHTDYLAQQLQGNSLMFMVSDTIRVGLLTDHLPLKEISPNITLDLIHQKIALIETSLRKDFRIRNPHIAVLGMNPHCGDHGVIGKEDDEIIAPAIKELYENGILVFGPYSADGFFASEQYKNFDAIVAPYHDQGLIPFKMLSFGNGVNYTAGLEYVRTSPDHGTAYEIAGKNLADASSFRQAVYTAIDIFRNRVEFKEITQNILQKQG